MGKYAIVIAGICVLTFVGLSSFSVSTSDQYLTQDHSKLGTNDSIYQKGKDLFVKNCQACHYLGMDKVATAPALGGITKRRDRDWLNAYTRDNQQMKRDGDSIAMSLLAEGWGAMNTFPQLTDDDLDALYFFVEQRYIRTYN